jgi:type I restriction enzyme, R subunit
MTIEQTFEELLRFVEALGEEEHRAVREGLDEETLAIFDLLKKESLSAAERQRIKTISVALLDKLKAEKLRIDHWRDKEATRDAVRSVILDFLWSDGTGLPVDLYSEADVQKKTEDVYRHVFWAYPVVPSPYYMHAAA